MKDKLFELLDTVQRTAIQVSDTAVDTVYGVSKKTEELVHVAKIKLRIMDRNADVNAALREVGEILYATHTGVPSDSEILLAKLQEIDALKAEIEALKAQIGRGSSCSCATCGAPIHENTVFCGECGEKL